MRVGIIKGSGTGSELAEVFKHTIGTICNYFSQKLEIVECQHIFSTYTQHRHDDPEMIETKVTTDVRILSDFYSDFCQSGGNVVFRTAINAETLYLFRQKAKAIQTALIPLGMKKMLLVRDEMQGYYSNSSWKIEQETVHFSGQFSKKDFSQVICFARQHAVSVLRKPFHIWVVYKHHLFANFLETWVREECPRARFYQPNHATEELFRYHRDTNDMEDILFIAGNEVGDILHEVFLYQFGVGTRTCLCSRNVFLHPDYATLTEYQTVHGSADEIADKGIVNPFATLRCVGEILEGFFSCENFRQMMEDVIGNAIKNGKVTPDMGGTFSTWDVVKHVIRTLPMNIVKQQ